MATSKHCPVCNRNTLHKVDYSMFWLSLALTICTCGCASPLFFIAAFTTWISNCQECGKGRFF